MCVLLGPWGQISYLHIADVMEYIQEMREILHNLQNRIQKTKQNIEGITQAMQVSELPRARRQCARDPAEAASRCSGVMMAREPLHPML